MELTTFFPTKGFACHDCAWELCLLHSTLRGEGVEEHHNMLGQISCHTSFEARERQVGVM